MSKQLAIKEVLNLDFFNYTTGKAEFRLDYCENTSVMTSAEMLDLRGGQGNYRLVSFDHTKTSTANIVANILDLSLLGKLAGDDYTLGTVTIPHDREVLSASASNTITIAATPASGTLQIFLLNGDRDLGDEQIAGTPGSTPNKYSIAGRVVTLNSTTAPLGTKFAVYYDYEAPATTGTINVTADKFAPYFRVVGTGLATDLVTGNANVPVMFELLKAKPKNNINLTLSSTDASKMEFDLDLFNVDQDDGTKSYFKMYVLV